MRKALLCAAIAALAACAASQLPNGGEMATNALIGPSWMEPAAHTQDLLYVSDEAGSVYVFSYPAAKLVGELTGFEGPGGLCSDKSGDVFVVDTPRGVVLEYTHGGRKPIWVVGAGGYPEGCAVDPTTGDFAITNYQTARPPGLGSVVVYTDLRKQSSTTYTDQSFGQFLFCGYDNSGNLYVDGVNPSTSEAEFAELRRRGTSLRDFKIDKPVAYPGGIQWDGSDLAIEDLSTDVLYRVKVSASGGRIVGSVHPAGDHSALLTQFWIQNGTIILPYGKGTRAVRRIGLWSYPPGGSPERVLEPRGAVELLGATVSLHR